MKTMTNYKSNKLLPQKKSRVLEYLHSIGVTRPKTDFAAAEMLLDIHKRFREREDLRLKQLAELPKWKRWILNTLNIPI
jgi:hypothetical protein